MTLKWDYQSGEHFLELDIPKGDNSEILMAKMKFASGHWIIHWWTSQNMNEDPKAMQFDGTLEEAKAMAVALVRMGCVE